MTYLVDRSHALGLCAGLSTCGDEAMRLACRLVGEYLAHRGSVIGKDELWQYVSALAVTHPPLAYPLAMIAAACGIEERLPYSRARAAAEAVPQAEIDAIEAQFQEAVSR